jgi:hypothetical protein
MAKQRLIPLVPKQTQTQTPTQEKNQMANTDLAFITEILAGSRSRTNSGAYVSEFLSSGELYREVDLAAGTFAGKDAKKVKTALDNARKKMTEDGKLVIPEGINVAVRVKDGKVFLINTTLFAAAQADAA